MRSFGLYIDDGMDGNWTLCELHGGVPVSGVAAEPGTTFMECVAALDGAKLPYGACRLTAAGLANVARWEPSAVVSLDGAPDVRRCDLDLEEDPAFGRWLHGRLQPES